MTIEAILDELGVPVAPAPRGGWVVRVPTAKRGEIAVHVDGGERTVTMRAFVMRGPDRGHDAVYRRLLGKNLETRHWRFALDRDGDIIAVADVPGAAMDASALDGLLGALSALVDEVYDGLLREGFGA